MGILPVGVSMTGGSAEQNQTERIVFFDGVCNVCNRFVDTLLRLDKKQVLKFASLQGQAAKSRLTKIDMNTVIYLRNGKQFEESSAVLMILKDLGGFWSALGRLGFWLPAILRNYLYRAFAGNRYFLFGQREQCRLPTKEERARFLD